MELIVRSRQFDFTNRPSFTSIHSKTHTVHTENNTVHTNDRFHFDRGIIFAMIK